MVLQKKILLKSVPTQPTHCMDGHLTQTMQGCSPKKEVGGRLKQDLDKDFFNNLDLYTLTLIHVRKTATADLWSCSAIQLLVFECL